VDETIVRLSDFKPDLLYEFRVPAETKSTPESPLAIEVEELAHNHSGPFLVHAFVLLPLKESADDQSGNDDKKAKKYVKIPFGAMDLLKPPGAKKTFRLFPYEAADAVRQRVKPGDHVLIGVEAKPVSKSKEDRDPDITLKVNRVLSW